MGALILIIEDEININQMLRDLFKLEGFEVDAAFDGDQGIEKARFGLPDAILLDIGLPNKSGWEVLEYLKANVQTQGIPVIILSGLGQESDVKKGSTLGAAKFLVKPCDPAQVINTVKEVLGLPSS